MSCVEVEVEVESNGYKKVGVIGCGASGLVTARELKREGFDVVVYEQNADVGGIWLYDPRVGEDPLGMNATASHGISYQSLRTNLSREVLAFMDYPFLVKEGRDPRRFPGHREVFLYLKDFVRDFNLIQLIRFNTKVEYVGMVDKRKFVMRNGEEVCDMDGDPSNEKNQQWVVRSRGSCDVNGQLEEEVFDAVVVCNGHYREPIIAEIPGLQRWPGKQIHSINYRDPEPFYGQVVVIIGSSSSASDISLELVKVAKEVHLSVRSKYLEQKQPLANQLNMQLHSTIRYLDENGPVIFEDGSSIIADSIIHCTGYSYSVPFLETNGMVTVDDNCVGPLYEHIFPPLLAPSLSFVGIPKQVISFPFFELQSKWIASILARKKKLPSRRDMMKSVKELYDYLETTGLPKRSTHVIGNFEVSEARHIEGSYLTTSCTSLSRHSIVSTPRAYLYFS